MIKPFIQTDFQDFVCQATKRCGISAKSQTTVSQFTFFQIAIGISSFGLLNSFELKTSFKNTASLIGFGISIHTAQSQGIGA
jgi:hypothetical protein